MRKNLDLLGTIDIGDGHVSTKSLGNILQIGGESLILESGREFSVGTRLTVNIVFPGQAARGDPFAHLHCTIRKVHDEPNLHYDLAIEDIDEHSRERLVLFLSEPNGGEKG